MQGLKLSRMPAGYSIITIRGISTRSRTVRVARMKLIKGMTYKEIAIRMGISLSTVKRTMKKVKETCPSLKIPKGKLTESKLKKSLICYCK